MYRPFNKNSIVFYLSVSVSKENSIFAFEHFSSFPLFRIYFECYFFFYMKSFFKELFSHKWELFSHLENNVVTTSPYHTMQRCTLFQITLCRWHISFHYFLLLSFTFLLLVKFIHILSKLFVWGIMMTDRKSNCHSFAIVSSLTKRFVILLYPYLKFHPFSLSCCYVFCICFAFFYSFFFSFVFRRRRKKLHSTIQCYCFWFHVNSLFFSLESRLFISLSYLFTVHIQKYKTTSKYFFTRRQHSANKRHRIRCQNKNNAMSNEVWTVFFSSLWRKQKKK